MSSIFTSVKTEDTSKDATLLTRLFSAKYCLPACVKEYLTAATYYCQVEVKVRDRIAAVDAIFPPVSCTDIISKQYKYGGRRVGLQTSNCDSFAKMSQIGVCKPAIFIYLFVCITPFCLSVIIINI